MLVQWGTDVTALVFGFGLAAALALRGGGFAAIAGIWAIVAVLVASLVAGMPTLTTWIDFALAILGYNSGLAAVFSFRIWQGGRAVA